MKTPLKIGLMGYGKMGKAIERLAETQPVEIVWKLNRSNSAAFSTAELQRADVVIEFSTPESACHNVLTCLQAGVKVVSGTTGWSNQIDSARSYCTENGGAFLWASNFSIGVNLFFAFNRFVAEKMSQWPEYQPYIKEIHHIHKLDAPSGTALTLLQDLMKFMPEKSGYALLPDIANASQIQMEAVRTGEVPGTHKLMWRSAVDCISMEHEAFSRDGFAAGALLAARWLANKQGCFSMEDVLFT
jgi:4-hydroxy-tetrahydrodipicolinate reductase